MPDSRLRTVEKRVVLRSVCAAATAEAKGPERLLGDERALRVRLAADGLRQAQPLGVDGEGDAADGQLIACREQLRRDEEVPRGEDDGVAGIGQQGAQPGAGRSARLVFHGKNSGQLTVDGHIDGLPHTRAVGHVHAHAAHERQRADKDDVLPNLRADAAAVIAAIGVRAAAAAELGLQQPVEQGGEGILRRFERGKRVGQHLPGGQRARRASYRWR